MLETTCMNETTLDSGAVRDNSREIAYVIACHACENSQKPLVNRVKVSAVFMGERPYLWKRKSLSATNGVMIHVFYECTTFNFPSSPAHIN